MKYSPTYKPFGDSAVLIEWSAEMNESILKDIISFEQKIRKNEYCVESIQSINSLTICYDSLLISYDELIHELKVLHKEPTDHNDSIEYYLWKIPTCYDSHFGIDIELLADKKRVSVEQLISLHSSTDYLVYSIGFLPGFIYLGGLHESLHTPRRATPRLKIDKGAIGIGGQQTGVYPVSSPGGWHIIGNTPVPLFDTTAKSPCFSKPGDRIRFVPISLEEHSELCTLTNNGSYTLEREVIHD